MREVRPSITPTTSSVEKTSNFCLNSQVSCVRAPEVHWFSNRRSLLLFRHPGEDSDVLMEKMQTTCRFIADLFAANVIYHEYDETVELGEILSLNGLPAEVLRNAFVPVNHGRT
jgi:hypothetical protein